MRASNKQAVRRKKRIKQRANTEEFAFQKSGIDLPAGAQHFIVKCIQVEPASAEPAIFKGIEVSWRYIHKRSLTRKSYAVTWGVTEILVVYDKSRQTLCNAYPRKFIKREERIAHECEAPAKRKPEPETNIQQWPPHGWGDTGA